MYATRIAPCKTRSLLLEVEEAFDSVTHLYHIRICSLVGWKGLFGVEEHTCAETHTSVVSLQDVIIFATLATLPEFFVVS